MEQEQQQQLQDVEDPEEEVEKDQPSVPKMMNNSSSTTTTTTTEAEVLACQFSSWYPLFAKFKRVTIPSVILDLPSEFIDYLLHTDQLILPPNTPTSSALLEYQQQKHPTPHDDDDSQWSNNDDEEDDNDESDMPSNFDFTNLNRQIETAIRSLGGAVAPKLNWSAPRDAVWINAGTMECRTPGDVYLLLKASDFCHFDLTQALPSSTTTSTWKPQLALRKWCHLYPSQEFRCFVHNQRLIAISQRNITQAWPHLVETRQSMQEMIRSYFQNTIIPNFHHDHSQTIQETTQHQLPQPQKYVMDVYVDQKQRVWLVDMNVWDARTDALLFDWEELNERIANPQEDNDENIDFRILESSTKYSIKTDPLSSYRAPVDTLQLASDTEFRNFMQMCERPSVIHDDDSDDEVEENK